MNYRSFLLIFIIIQTMTLSAFSREDTIRLGRSYGLQMAGFARIDYIYDTRQTNEAVEGLFTFFPLAPQLDANGKDINATPKANFASIASRLSWRFFAPDVFGAKSTAYIEFDFTGTSNTNGVRMRQAWVNFGWKKTNLLLGRTWHPFATGTVPNVIALNTGAPFWAFNRSDMLRFDYKPGNWLLQAFALYQSDYCSLGPDLSINPSGKNPVYLRDATLPELAAHIAYKKSGFQLGAVGSVKTIKPRQFTISQNTGDRYKTNEKLTTYAAQAYAQYQVANFILKAQVNYLQNTTESLQIGGYAVSEINPATGHEKYTPTQYMNYWVNMDYGKKWQVGMFLGYLNSMGTLDNVADVNRWFARGNNIKYMYRISPHIFYNVNNWQFATEFEYTAAAFGKIENDKKAKIVDAKEVANFRTNLLICFYF